MAYRNGPKIVTDGLVLCLDAAIGKSYPGSGTSWTDLSGNGNNGTLVNGPTFSSANGGSIVLDGVNDYISTTSISISTFTYEGWLYNNLTGGSTNYGYFFSGSDGRGLAVSEGGNAGIGLVAGSLYYYNGAAPISLGINIPSNTWTNICCIGNSTNNTVQIYKNSIYGTSTSVTNSQSVITAFGIYKYGNSHYWDGGFSIKRLYNRALSADEILQNYKATKGRFGL